MKIHIYLIAIIFLASVGAVPVNAGMLLPYGEEDKAADDEYGKLNVVILGDSNTSIGGDDCDKDKGWSKWFRDKLKPATCRSYARSGATWTNTASTTYNVTENIGVIGNNNVIYNQINRLKEDYKNGKQPEPHLIIIAAGTNDAWFVKSRPGAFSKTAEQAFAGLDGYVTGRKASSILSLAESVRYGCEMLMQSFPDAQIILLTPLQTTAAPASSIRQAGDIIEECGHYMSICVIRQDFCSGVYCVREKTAKAFTYDGTHTSTEGARRNGCFIANQIKALLNR